MLYLSFSDPEHNPYSGRKCYPNSHIFGDVWSWILGMESFNWALHSPFLFTASRSSHGMGLSLTCTFGDFGLPQYQIQLLIFWRCLHHHNGQQRSLQSQANCYQGQLPRNSTPSSEGSSLHSSLYPWIRHTHPHLHLASTQLSLWAKEGSSFGAAHLPIQGGVL